MTEEDHRAHRAHVEIAAVAQGGATPECMELALRLATVVQKMRAEARFNLETFLNAAEAELGGQVTMLAPRKAGKRSVPEARYMGECDNSMQ